MADMVFYGGIKSTPLGTDVYKTLDGAEVWSDGGAGVRITMEAVQSAIADFKQQLSDQLGMAITQYGVDQARDAMAEIAESGEFRLGIVNGKVTIAYDASTEVSTLLATADLEALIRSAQSEAAQSGDPIATQVFGHLIANFKKPSLSMPKAVTNPAMQQARRQRLLQEAPAVKVAPRGRVTA